MEGTLGNIYIVLLSIYYVSDIRLNTCAISFHFYNSSIIQVPIVNYSTDKETNSQLRKW